MCMYVYVMNSETDTNVIHNTLKELANAWKKKSIRSTLEQVIVNSNKKTNAKLQEASKTKP